MPPGAASGHVPRAFSLRVYVGDMMGLRLARGQAAHAISCLADLSPTDLSSDGDLLPTKTEDDQRLIAWMRLDG